MKEYNPEASILSWAIRFAASQEGVIMVLIYIFEWTLSQVFENFL